MAKYCVKCGRKLPDGGICPCRIKKISWPSEKKDIFQNKNGVSFWKILGLNDPEYDDKQDYYERGKKIVPDVIAPIESEVPIKQYHVADLRARLQGLWAEGRLMITNKRVLFRASGRSFFGRTQVQSEYTIDEISGFNISRGIRFGGVDIFLALLILALSVYGSNILSTLIEKWFVSLLFMILGFVGLVVIPHQKYRFHLLATGIICGSCLYIAQVATMAGKVSLVRFLLVILILLGILSLILLFKASTKSVISMSVLCKNGTAEAIGIQSVQKFGLQWAPEVLPAEDAQQAIKEIGAIVRDIQQRGDYGIDKWKTFNKE